MKRIYLTTEQIENLIFHKIIILSENDVQRERASNRYKFSVLVEEDKVIKQDKQYIIFFSAVSKFEIPKSEKNLYLHHFHIPLGLLEVVNRSVPTTDPPTEIKFSFEDEKAAPFFVKLRRGLLPLVMLGYKQPACRQSLEHFIKHLSLGLTEIEAKFIHAIIDKDEFPSFFTQEIKSPEYFRYIWWGKFIKDNIFNPLKGNIDAEVLKEYSLWLKNHGAEEKVLWIRAMHQVPEPVNEERNFLLGYKLAATIPNTPEPFEKRLSVWLDMVEMKGQEYNEIRFWAVFFDAFFKEQNDYIIPNPLIQENFFQMEKIAYILLLSLQRKSNHSFYASGKWNFKDFHEDEWVLNFENLLNGKAMRQIKLITEKDVLQPFSGAMLSKNNRKKIGFVNVDFDGVNRLNFDGQSFIFRGNFSRFPVTFYGNLSGKEKEKIKNAGIHIKIKPLEKLVDKNKKILVGFLSQDTPEVGLLSIYRNLADKTNLQKMILVWIVNDQKIGIHSTEFALQKSKLKEQIERSLGLETSVVVKSSAGSEIETIRNLRLLLKGYRLKNIEVIDEGFTPQYAGWLLKVAGDEIVVKWENHRYFAYHTFEMSV